MGSPVVVGEGDRNAMDDAVGVARGPVTAVHRPQTDVTELHGA
jgi:hypothetical protein